MGLNGISIAQDLRNWMNWMVVANSFGTQPDLHFGIFLCLPGYPQWLQPCSFWRNCCLQHRCHSQSSLVHVKVIILSKKKILHFLALFHVDVTQIHALCMFICFTLEKTFLRISSLICGRSAFIGLIVSCRFFIVWLDDTVGVVDHMVSHAITFLGGNRVCHF